MLERWPQVCRVKITFTKIQTNCFVSTTKISMKCQGVSLFFYHDMYAEKPKPTNQTPLPLVIRNVWDFFRTKMIFGSKIRNSRQKK